VRRGTITKLKKELVHDEFRQSYNPQNLYKKATSYPQKKKRKLPSNLSKQMKKPTFAFDEEHATPSTPSATTNVASPSLKKQERVTEPAPGDHGQRMVFGDDKKETLNINININHAPTHNQQIVNTNYQQQQQHNNQSPTSSASSSPSSRSSSSSDHITYSNNYHLSSVTAKKGGHHRFASSGTVPEPYAVVDPQWQQFLLSEHAYLMQHIQYFPLIEHDIPWMANAQNKYPLDAHLMERTLLQQMRYWIERYGVPAMVAHEEVHRLKKDLIKVNEEADTLEEESVNLTQQVFAMEHEVQLLQVHNHKLQSEAQELQRQYASLHALYEEKCEEYTDMESRYESEVEQLNESMREQSKKPSHPRNNNSDSNNRHVSSRSAVVTLKDWSYPLNAPSPATSPQPPRRAASADPDGPAQTVGFNQSYSVVNEVKAFNYNTGPGRFTGSASPTRSASGSVHRQRVPSTIREDKPLPPIVAHHAHRSSKTLTTNEFSKFVPLNTNTKTSHHSKQNTHYQMNPSASTKTVGFVGDAAAGRLDVQYHALPNAPETTPVSQPQLKYVIKPKNTSMEKETVSETEPQQPQQPEQRVSIKANVALNESDLLRLEVVDKDDLRSESNIEITAEIDEYENSDDGWMSEEDGDEHDEKVHTQSAKNSLSSSSPKSPTPLLHQSRTESVTSPSSGKHSFKFSANAPSRRPPSRPPPNIATKPKVKISEMVIPAHKLKSQNVRQRPISSVGTSDAYKYSVTGPGYNSEITTDTDGFNHLLANFVDIPKEKEMKEVDDDPDALPPSGPALKSSQSAGGVLKRRPIAKKLPPSKALPTIIANVKRVKQRNFKPRKHGFICIAASELWPNEVVSTKPRFYAAIDGLPERTNLMADEAAWKKNRSNDVLVPILCFFESEAKYKELMSAAPNAAVRSTAFQMKFAQCCNGMIRLDVAEVDHNLNNLLKTVNLEHNVSMQSELNASIGAQDMLYIASDVDKTEQLKIHALSFADSKDRNGWLAAMQSMITKRKESMEKRRSAGNGNAAQQPATGRYKMRLW